MQEGNGFFRKARNRRRIFSGVPAEEQAFLRRAAAADEEPFPGQQRLEVPVPQGGMFLPQGDHPAIDGFQRIGTVKGHGTAVLVFRGALQPFLIAVKDAGHSRKGHLEQNRLLHSGPVAAAEGEKPADVVAVQQVQLSRKHLPGDNGSASC